MKIMTLKSSINMATATLILMSLLFAYFTWSSKNWVESVNAQITTQEERYVAVQPRLTKIEVENSMHWQETDRRLQTIETKIDRVLNYAGGK